MSPESAPTCRWHPSEVRMLLSTLHSDQAYPGDLLARYECPECGAERRLPVDLRPAAQSSEAA